MTRYPVIISKLEGEMSEDPFSRFVIPSRFPSYVIYMQPRTYTSYAPFTVLSDYLLPLANSCTY